MTVAVITDSTSYLPQELMDEYNIKFAPLKVIWGEETQRDAIDIMPDEFYKRLAREPKLPTTSQPSMHDFLEVFKSVDHKYNAIVAVLISSGISGTVASALAAKKDYTDHPVEVVDTLNAAVGHGLSVLAAARAAADGADLDAVVSLATRVANNTKTFFVVDTLEYLYKGGRIGGASRFFGSALKIKPILALTETGHIDAYDKVRSQKKALQKLVSLITEKAAGRPIRLGMMHANALETAEQVAKQIQEQAHVVEIITSDISPAIGVHVGPGTVGVAFYPVETEQG